MLYDFCAAFCDNLSFNFIPCLYKLNNSMFMLSKKNCNEISSNTESLKFLLDTLTNKIRKKDTINIVFYYLDVVSPNLILNLL